MEETTEVCGVGDVSKMSWSDRAIVLLGQALTLFDAYHVPSTHEGKECILVSVKPEFSMPLHCKIHQFQLMHEGFGYTGDRETWCIWFQQTDHADPDCSQVCTLAERLRLQAAGLV